MAPMSPRPTPPSDPDPQPPVEPAAESVDPDPGRPAVADDTTVLPEAPVATASYAAAGPPRPPQRWWGQATATSGGRIALAVGGLFTVAVLLAGAALVGGLVLRAVGGGDRDRMAFSEERGRFSDERGPFGNQRGDRPGRGGDNPGQQRRREMAPEGPRRRIVPPVVPDRGRGSTGMGRGKGGLGLGALGGGVLHGELTATVDGKPTVLVVQTGEVKTYTSGPSLVIRSSDGFEATYVLDGSVAATRGAKGLATGAEVRVVAKKEGMSVMRLVVIT